MCVAFSCAVMRAQPVPRAQRRVTRAVWAVYAELYPGSGPAVSVDREPYDDPTLWRIDQEWMREAQAAELESDESDVRARCFDPRLSSLCDPSSRRRRRASEESSRSEPRCGAARRKRVGGGGARDAEGPPAVGGGSR